MRKKEWKVVVTFHTTLDAMEMEKMCKEQEVPGRLIPIPRSLSSGCGLAWCTNPEERKVLEANVKQFGIRWNQIQECLV